MVFNAGDVVVTPGCGVGHIEEIDQVDIGDEPVKMYKILLQTTGMRMWVPTYRAEVDGVRRPIETEAVAKVLKVIRETKAPKKRSNWNRRQRRYQGLLMSNDPMQLAELLGELASVRQKKTLSFGERRLFERAHGLLLAELEAACESGEDVAAKFEEALAA